MANIVRIAHRGASGQGHAPENTLAAFNKALKMEVDAVECDVHCTRDESVVVIHDGELGRTTNMSGVVADMTLKDIKKADAGLWFDPKFAGERIPTLREVLDLTRGKALTVIEVKQEGIAYKVIEEIEKADSAGEVIVISFHESVLKDAQGINPRIPRALLIGGKVLVRRMPTILELIQKTAEVGAGTLNVSRRIVTPRLVREANLRGIGVWAWTVDYEDEIEKLVEMGVSGITSNYPERLRSAGARSSR